MRLQVCRRHAGNLVTPARFMYGCDKINRTVRGRLSGEDTCVMKGNGTKTEVVATDVIEMTRDLRWHVDISLFQTYLMCHG